MKRIKDGMPRIRHNPDFYLILDIPSLILFIRVRSLLAG
jgi:hypothetical protein